MLRALAYPDNRRLVEANRACAADPAAQLLRRCWLAARTTRELARAGAYPMALEYARKLGEMTVAATRSGLVSAPLADGLKRRYFALVDEIGATMRRDLGRLGAGAEARS